MDNCDLSPHMLIKAYSLGLFPMADIETGKLNWYKPDPRAIISLEKFHVSRSLRRLIKRSKYRISYSTQFSNVMRECSKRKNTWISTNLINSYTVMFRMGAGQSIEVWEDQVLVGGVYGINLGGAFFAESMFHNKSNTSKLALFYLIEKLKENNFVLLECQYMTDHLRSLGAEEISDIKYQKILKKAIALDVFFHR